MIQRHDEVGFSQRVRLEWLEQTSAYVLAGASAVDIVESLRDLLRGKVSIGGDPKRGTREKIVTILRCIWIPGAGNWEGLRKRGLCLLQKYPKDHHMILHWGMAMAAYPFWAAVADTVGRLLRLQGTVNTTQVQRRLRERYGERETVARATRRVLRSFIDWSALVESKTKGTYLTGQVVRVDQIDLVAWLVEAMLCSTSGSQMSGAAALTSPSLFPFVMPSVSCDRIVSASPGLDVVRHGLNDEFLVLKK